MFEKKPHKYTRLGNQNLKESLTFCQNNMYLENINRSWAKDTKNMFKGGPRVKFRYRIHILRVHRELQLDIQNLLDRIKYYVLAYWTSILLPRVHSYTAGSGKLKTLFPRYPFGQGSRCDQGLLFIYTGTMPEVRAEFGDKAEHEASILPVKIMVAAAQF